VGEEREGGGDKTVSVIGEGGTKRRLKMAFHRPSKL
jgi:hypothetical protein